MSKKSTDDLVLAELELDALPKATHPATGTPICPGYPKMCLGVGVIPSFPRLCETCEHVRACYPTETLQRAALALQHVGAKLKQRRVKLNKTAAEISFKTGVSQTDIQRIELGMDTGNFFDVYRVAEVLDVDIADLLKKAMTCPITEIERCSPAEGGEQKDSTAD